MTTHGTLGGEDSILRFPSSPEFPLERKTSGDSCSPLAASAPDTLTNFEPAEDTAEGTCRGPPSPSATETSTPSRARGVPSSSPTVHSAPGRACGPEWLGDVAACWNRPRQK